MYNFYIFRFNQFLIFIISSILLINSINAQNWTEHNIYSEFEGLGNNPEIGSGDVDNDGDIDIIINDFNAISYFPNNGTGNFGTKVTIATGWGLHWGSNLIFTDREGDGDSDFLTADRNGAINWLINDGMGHFSELLVGSLAHEMNDFDLQDIDGDNDLDVVASTHVSALPNNEQLAWFENTGLNDYNKHIVATNVGFRRFVKAIDLDGDGDNDIMTFSRSDDSLKWYENDGTGSFSEEMIIETTFYNDILDFSVIDLSGDGLKDILFSSKATGTSVTGWRKNNGNATFSNIISINNTGAGGIFSISHSFPVDYDSDGDIDVVATGTYNDELSIYLNNGIGIFQLFGHVFEDADISPYNTCAGDFDGDGMPDPVCYYDTDPTANNHDHISWYEFEIAPTFTAVLLDLLCDDNDTPSDGTDDFLKAIVGISASLLNQELVATVDHGSVSPNNGFQSDDSIIFEFEPGSAGGGNKTLTISNTQTPNYSQDILIEDIGNCISTSTHTTKDNHQLIVMPNPTSSFVELLNDTHPIDLVELFDLEGRKLFVLENKNYFDCSSFQTGTYILRIRLKNKQIVYKKLVKY